MTKTFTMTVLAAAASVSFAAAATAQQPASQAPTQLIDLTGVDLSSPATLDRIRDSIRRAARNVCGVRSTANLNERRLTRVCYNTAIAGGESQIERRLAAQNGTPGSSGGSLAISAPQNVPAK